MARCLAACWLVCVFVCVACLLLHGLFALRVLAQATLQFWGHISCLGVGTSIQFHKEASGWLCFIQSNMPAGPTVMHLLLLQLAIAIGSLCFQLTRRWLNVGVATQ